MKKLHGIRLAQEMKLMYPKVNIVFCTGYDEYYEEAFGLHASGYLQKPVTAEKVKQELDDLRYPVVITDVRKRVRFRTFGYLEMFVDENPVSFYYEKTKEMVAYLVMDTMKKLKCEDIVVRGRNRIGIVTDKVDCDYFDWKQGSPYALNVYHGEYMVQYGWAEMTNGFLSMKKRN